MNIANGTYNGFGGVGRVYISESGSLVMCMEYHFEDGVALKGYQTMALDDGNLQPRTIESLRSWSGWDGCDPFWFDGIDLSQTPCELVITNEPGLKDKTKLWPKIKWINARGGSGGGEMPKSGDKAVVAAKWGAKFRATAGGQPMQRKPPAPPVAPKQNEAGAGAPPPNRRPVTPAAPQSTEVTAWGLMDRLGAKMTKELREEKWYAFVDATGMKQDVMTPEGWAQIEAAIQTAADDGTLELPF